MIYFQISFGRYMQIDHKNLKSRSLNLGTPNIVKNPKLQFVTNYQNNF